MTAAEIADLTARVELLEAALMTMSGEIRTRRLAVEDAEGRERIALEIAGNGVADVIVKHPTLDDVAVHLQAGGDAEGRAPACMVVFGEHKTMAEVDSRDLIVWDGERMRENRIWGAPALR